MRYEKGHKEGTRARILEVASRDFRAGGVPGVGIARIMGDAGLTNGAFYAHFPSKDALVREAVVLALAEQLRSFGGTADLETIVRAYLSPEHRDHPADGCVSAAAVADVARLGEETRRAYTDGLLEVLEAVAEDLAPGESEARLDRALVIFGSMLGCLQVARAVSDPVLSDRILDAGIGAALLLAAAPIG